MVEMDLPKAALVTGTQVGNFIDIYLDSEKDGDIIFWDRIIERMLRDLGRV
jgi:hypothetical protein